jgi:hypothetical protein
MAVTAEKVLAAVEELRSTWQGWHVRAEAHRQVRAAQIATDKVDQLVELLVAEVLQTRSVALTRPEDGITEVNGTRVASGSNCLRSDRARHESIRLDPCLRRSQILRHALCP